jgi:hypothetical protein
LPGDLWPCKRSEGDEVRLVYSGRKDPEYNDGSAFLIAKFKRSTLRPITVRGYQGHSW